MAAAPKPSGGRKPGQFGTTELRLGRATGIGEFFDVLEDATAKRMERMAKGYLHAITASALSPLPTFAQASIYDAITDPFGGGRDTAQDPTGTAEREPNLDKLYNVPLPVITQEGEEHGTAQKVASAIGIGGTRVPLWQSNLEKLFKVTLLITEKKDTLKLIETERETEPEKVKDDEKPKFSMKDFFSSLFGGIVDLGAWILKGIGTLAIGALKFTGGLGIMGLMASLIFNKEIVDQFRLKWGEEAEKLGAKTEWGARIAKFLGGGEANGQSFEKAAIAGLKGGGIGAITGLFFGGLPGALVGFLLGSAFMGLGAALGEAKITMGTNFLATWLEKTWEAARMEWEDAKQVQLNAELKELRNRLNSGKETEESLILIQMQIRAKEAELLESRMEHAKQWQEMVDDEYAKKGVGIEIQKEAQDRLKEFKTELFEAQEEIESLTRKGKIDKKETYLGIPGIDTYRENIHDDLKDKLISYFQRGDVAGRQALNLMKKYGIINDKWEVTDPRLLTDHVYRKDLFEALNNVIQTQIDKDEEWRKGSGAGAKAFREAQKNLKKVIEDRKTSNAVLDTTGQKTEVVEKTIDWTKTLDNTIRFGMFDTSTMGGGAGGVIMPSMINNDGSVHTNSALTINTFSDVKFSTENLKIVGAFDGHV